MIGILIVEDERIVAMAMEKALRRMRYSVTGITDSAELALEKLSQTPSDLVLMDIRLRGEMDGIQAAAEIRARYDIPVVYISAYADEETLQRAKVTEAYGYVLKPFEERDLRVAVEMALYKHGAERQLRQRERWLQATLSRTHEAVVGINAKGQVNYLNQAAQDLCGWAQEAAWGSPADEVLDLRDAEGQAQTKSTLRQSRRRNEIIELLNAWLRPRKGGPRPVEATVAPVLDDRGEFSSWVCILRDVSEGQTRQEELQDLAERYRLLLRSSSDALLHLDAELKVMDCNQAMADLLGAPHDQLLGAEFASLPGFAPHTHFAHRELFSRLLLGEDVPPFCMKFPAGGQERSLDIRADRLMRKGRLVCLQIRARDAQAPDS